MKQHRCSSLRPCTLRGLLLTIAACGLVSEAGAMPIMFTANGSVATAAEIQSGNNTSALPPETQPPAFTKIAKGSIALQSPNNNSFELPVLGSASFQLRGNGTSWTMTGNAGVSARNSTYTIDNPLPQQGLGYGNQVAFLQGNATMSTTYNFTTTGFWRVRYFAAQRVVQGTANKQQIGIHIDSVPIDLETPAGSPLGSYEYASRPVWLTAGNHNVKFLTSDLNGSAADETVLVDKIRFERIRTWSTAGDWYGPDGITTANAVPTASDYVSIPPEAVVVIKGNCVAATLNVKDAELLVGNEPATLAAQWVMISGAGSSFKVGKPEFPHPETFTLTLTGGNATKDNIKGAGTHFLMAMGGGSIIMHGSPKRSWTKLTANAMEDATSITVADATGWSINDEIVIAPSSINSHVDEVVSTPQQGSRILPDQKESQIEKRRITYVSADQKTFSFADGLLYDHLGVNATYSHDRSNIPTVVDLRAEVGLLTHNLKIQGGGDADGGHVMLMKSPTCGACIANGGGFGQFSNVEFYQMGQKQRMARYPIHWHMLDDEGNGQFIRNCSIHDSRNRAITLHGSSYVSVEWNVAYDHIGHGIFLEDATERFNQINYNLVLGTRKAGIQPAHLPTMGDSRATYYDDYDEARSDFEKNEALLPSDNMPEGFKMHAPAAFWITNPRNYFIGNVAAGTLGTGFWFALPTGPLGLSAKDDRFVNTNKDTNGGKIAEPYPLLSTFTAPINEVLGEFSGNTVHSAGGGFLVNDTIYNTRRDTYDPSAKDDEIIRNRSWAPPSLQTISKFNIYATKSALYSGLGKGLVTYEKCVFADNYEHIFFADSETVTDSLLVADTGNGLAPLNEFTTPIGTANATTAKPDRYNFYAAYVAYDGPGRLRNSHLVGYGDGDSYAPYSPRLIHIHSAAMRHTNHRFSRLSYDNGVPWIKFNDVSGPVTDHNYSSVENIFNPRQWGASFVDEDGDLSGNAAYAGHSIISNHPMMRCSDDMTWKNGADTNTKISKRKFGFFEIDYPGTTVVEEMPDVQIFRLGGITSNRSQEMTPPAFLNKFKTMGSNQLPMIAGNATTTGAAAFYYRCILKPSSVPAPGEDLKTKLGVGSTNTKTIRIGIKNLDPGDVSPLISIEGSGDLPIPIRTIEMMQNSGFAEYENLNLLKNAPQSGYFIFEDALDQSKDRIYFRMVIPSSGSSQQVTFYWNP